MHVHLTTEAGHTLRVVEIAEAPAIGDHFYLFGSTDNDRYAVQRLAYVVYGDRATDERDQVKPSELAHCVATVSRVAPDP